MVGKIIAHLALVAITVRSSSDDDNALENMGDP